MVILEQNFPCFKMISTKDAMIIETDPSSVGEEAARVGVVLDLLGGPEAEGHDVPALHLPNVDLGADGGPRVLDEVGAPQVDLKRLTNS